jgi:hypothetical protein
MNALRINDKLAFILFFGLICSLLAGCTAPVKNVEPEITAAPPPPPPPPPLPLVSRFPPEVIDAAYASTAASTKSTAPIVSSATAPGRPTTTSAQTSGQIALTAGIEHYKNSQYTQAISKLQQAVDLSNGDYTTQVTAYKYMSFSMCVNGKRTPCRQSFDKLLRLDSNFELSPAEAGHPSWGPVFRQAKAAAIK